MVKKPYRAVRRYALNTQGRDFVVGDVHGCFSLLDEKLASVAYDSRNDRLFSVGDLVDRGPESTLVLDAVRQHKIKAIRGNHEDMILRWYTGYTSSDQLLANGAEWFIAMADGSGRAKRFANFMASLPYAIEIESSSGLIALLHADVPFDDWGKLTAALGDERRGDLVRRQVLWQRSRWREYREGDGRDFSPSLATVFGLPVGGLRSATFDPHREINGVFAAIVGHTPVPKPTVRGNVINIDTGAVYGGTLTVLNLNDLPHLLSCSEAG
ncbi:serine/threonine protein phosphatase [Burkholderia sp. Bp8963]|nr:serine/threonine protein phosphatase [Burkholderia sp. Bp8963]